MPDQSANDLIQITRLPSGLTVVTERMDRVETVSFGAYVASGSTITDDVEAEALAIARSRQVTKPGYARKLKGPGH